MYVCIYMYICIYGPCLWIGFNYLKAKLQSHYEETVYFLPLSSHKFLVLI